MTSDNIRLSLWIVGIWGGLIIFIIGGEAWVHDGAIAATIVDIFGKVLMALCAAVVGVLGLGKFFDTKQAISAGQPSAASPVPVPLAAPQPVPVGLTLPQG